MQNVSAPPVRRSRRLLATFPVSLFLDRDDSGTGIDAYTVDISRFGARIRTTFVLSPGETIGFAASEDSGPPTRSRVVWVQRASVAGSLAGVEFLEPFEA